MENGPSAGIDLRDDDGAGAAAFQLFIARAYVNALEAGAQPRQICVRLLRQFRGTAQDLHASVQEAVSDHIQALFDILLAASQDSDIERFQPEEEQADHKVALDIRRWRAVLDMPCQSLKAQQKKITTILNYFIDIGKANSLRGTPALIHLENALEHVQKQNDPATAFNLHWKTTIAQTSSQLQTWRSPDSLTILKDIPITNIWDSISFIYTFCVEDISNQTKAELHLYQFRTILSALRSCEYFTAQAGPCTAAATWSSPPSSQSLTIAFATTCVGPRQNKVEIGAARLKFMHSATRILEKWYEARKPEVGPLNIAGNCPEYVAWGIVCRKPGTYYSLCFSVDSAARSTNHPASSLEFCGWC